MDQLKELGWAKRWSSQPNVSCRTKLWMDANVVMAKPSTTRCSGIGPSSRCSFSNTQMKGSSYWG
uniref:Uncharacterized protein n=1 Tax=Oryza rufipogon TaxID=4529 RepID=A0A0E0MWV1_ORYRU